MGTHANTDQTRDEISNSEGTTNIPSSNKMIDDSSTNCCTTKCTSTDDAETTETTESLMKKTTDEAGSLKNETTDKAVDTKNIEENLAETPSKESDIVDETAKDTNTKDLGDKKRKCDDSTTSTEVAPKAVKSSNDASPNSS